MNNNEIKFLAYYLPQFHPIPENDAWWGTGFTEWTNVKKGKPLFKGHNQPIQPGELGYYDLLKDTKIQEQQAVLAKTYGIDGFIYYQYWFGHGKMLLEKPAEKMLTNKASIIPFCFCWANESWKGFWHGLHNDKILIEQTYPGAEDYGKYFDYLLPFFRDSRYIKVDNKPMFHVYRFDDIPDINLFINTFNALAIKNGFEGIYFIATIASPEVLNNEFIYGKVGVDVFVKMRYGLKFWFLQNTILGRLERRIRKEINKRLLKSKNIYEGNKPLIYDYKKGVKKINTKFSEKKHIPCVFPNWDNSPRSGSKSMIFKNATPDSWKIHLEDTLKELKQHPNNPPYLVIKSWNEWAEGNYLEPDGKYGRRWLEVIKEVKDN